VTSPSENESRACPDSADGKPGAFHSATQSLLAAPDRKAALDIARVPAPTHKEAQSSVQIVVVLLLLTSFLLTLWYATVWFIPYIWLSDLGIGFDAFRYQVFAQRNSQYSLIDILSGPDAAAFGQSGYPVLLSLLYGLTTSDPLVGCMLNWTLWVAAGFLLVPLAKSESEKASSLPFLTLWLLYPESVDWNGMTSKEPLVVFAVACVLRTCSSRARMWTQTLIVAGLFCLMLWVRQVAAPLMALALAISFEFRKTASPARGSRTVLLAVALVFLLYVTGGAPADEPEVANPLDHAGYSWMEQTATAGLSNGSLLRQMGSADRLVDSLWAPIRGISYLFSPLYYNPFSIPDIQTQLQWISALLCSAATLAILLRLLSRGARTHSRAILFGVLLLGLLALGLSGIMHLRYRSLIVAALLPLGMRSFREELAERGYRRLIVYGAVTPVFIFILYRVLRQFS